MWGIATQLTKFMTLFNWNTKQIKYQNNQMIISLPSVFWRPLFHCLWCLWLQTLNYICLSLVFWLADSRLGSYKTKQNKTQATMNNAETQQVQLKHQQRPFALPPFNNMGLIVPVFPRSLCVYIRVNSRAAWDRARHILHGIFSKSPKTNNIKKLVN